VFVVEAAPTGFYYGNLDLPDKRLILFIASPYPIGKIDLLLKVKGEKTKGPNCRALIFCHVLVHAFAISLTKAVYMISVKRFSVVIRLIYGGSRFLVSLKQKTEVGGQRTDVRLHIQVSHFLFLTIVLCYPSSDL